ncbi:MAG: phosphatase [Defluviitaleaceae bacterium]|nr:phosphatase [Defluviitaleaceae bacterium]MCL2238320.1 phosphatase [Defluviitaleaceae bacterium]
MRFVLDVHCHTISSGHAYSTATENAAHAASLGLTHIGMADHGPAMPGAPHFYHFGNMRIVPEMMHGVRVLKGAEVNICDIAGAVDLSEEIMERMDFIIAAMHRGVIAPTNKADHTRAMIKTMENPWVSILGHPGDSWFDIDYEAVVQAAARTNTIVEINNQTLNPISLRYSGEGPQRKLLALCKEYQVPVLASSDAHYHTLVGELRDAKALILESGIPPSLVLNTDPELFFAAVARKRSGQ